MRVQIKVWEGDRSCEVLQEANLPELDVTDEEFEALVAELSGNFAELLVIMLKRKNRKIVVLGEG